jgi:hypothetical protein
MMTDEYKWGDDPGVAIEKSAGTPLAAAIEEDVVSGYLLELRKKIENNAEVRRMVAESRPAQSVKSELAASYGPAKPGTEHLLERAAQILLDELEQQRAAKPSLYLVSCQTGRAVVPISAKDVYIPPDYVGLDGGVHKSRPVVHPGLSSTLALASHESAKHQSLLARATPETAAAYAHLSAPEQILSRVKQKLADKVEFADLPGETAQEIEFGREHISGLEQSANLSFHRVELFAATLARKIALLGSGGRCCIDGIRACHGSKQRWYVCTARFANAAASRD